MFTKTILSFSALFIFLAACNNGDTAQQTEKKDTMQTRTAVLPDPKNYQQTIDGKATDLYRLRNGRGITAYITNYGGRVVSLLVPDKNGKVVDVSIGHSGIQA